MNRRKEKAAMKENKGTKRNLKFIFAAAFIMILAMGTIALTGCGGSGSTDQAAEPEVIINPLTGIEVESEDALPARPVQVSPWTVEGIPTLS